MKITAVVLAHNAIKHQRIHLLSKCISSLGEADQVLVVDNGSTDGTEAYVMGLGGFTYKAADNNHTCGRGMNICITAAAKHGDIVVFSNDDIIWRPGWRAQLEAFWADAPAEVAIVSGLLEQDYPWNQPKGTVEAGGLRGLWRETVPGGAWTLRSKDWPAIGPVPERVGWDDVPTCRRVTESGRRCIAVDLCDHAGVDLSTWGNGSQRFGKPLDKEKLGL